MMKVGIVSLGCPKNQVDSEHMLGALELNGFEIVEPPNAEVLIINTCAFVQAAVEESIECILEACEERPKKKVIVTGCLPQRYGEKLIEAVPEIDYAIGVGRCEKIVDVVKKVLEGQKGISVSSPNPSFRGTRRHLLSPPHYAYIKIADGCSNKCSYCVIPSLRGKYRSRNIGSILREARELTERGVKELILTAQDTALYGVDIYNSPVLPRLLSELSKIDEIGWIRILYLHPAHISPEFVDAIAHLKKVCKYLDIPIQHISDRILSRMHRRVTGSDIRSLIDLLKKKIPGLALRTTVMVGFPGETDEDFNELLQFVEDTKFNALGIFKFSPEKETKAYNLAPLVEEDLMHERVAILQEVQREISYEMNQLQVGNTLRVLIDEKIGDNEFRGRAEFQTPDIDGVVYIRGSNLKVGDFAEVNIFDANDYDFFACKRSSGNRHSVFKRERNFCSGNSAQKITE